MKGTLYIVSTPIGNLEDITFRAVRVLKEVDLIAAEDTRRTKKLLNHYGISTPLTSCFEHNEAVKGPALVARVEGGEKIALVSDAGTPAISDPGYRLVRLALENSINIEVIPGPSAVTSSLTIAGLPTDAFAFHGFPPSKKGEKKRFIEGLRGEGKTVVL